MNDLLRAFRASIVALLGHAPETIEPGRFHRFATSDRRNDDAGWCKLFDDMRGGVFGCYRQGISERWSSADWTTITREQRADMARQVRAVTAERESQQRKQWTANAKRNAELWAQCVPPGPRDPVTEYLARRAIASLWPLPEALRFHRSLPYWHENEKLGTFPAMVAPDGRTLALHRTYLTADGRKADLPSPKKLTGAAGLLNGASIPLHKPVRGCIGIAEGIETALAAWCASAVPTVASYCAGNMAAWRWPAGVQRIVVFADNDKAGREAADKLRARVSRAGLQASVMTPTNPGSDWCDVWAERDAVLIEAEPAA